MGRRKISGPEFWPAIDRALYCDGLARYSRRTGQRRYVALSPATRNGVERDYGVSLRWLQRQGLLDPEAEPARRWPLEVAEAMALSMLGDGLSVASVHSRVGRLKRALTVMQPSVCLTYIDALLREFERPQPRFDPIVWKVTSADLQAFGIELMDKAAEVAAASGNPEAAVYCWGMQIALIAARPWRKTVFTLMELWTSMTREGGLWRMRAHSHQTKQKRYQSGLIPAKLVNYFDNYVHMYRPVLCQIEGYTGNALWINKHGRPMTPRQFLVTFTELTADKFSERITVHAVRKIAATTMAVRNPRHVDKIAGILGHTRHDTGERHYVLASTIQAHDDLDATLDRLSRSVRDRRRLSRRKERRLR